MKKLFYILTGLFIPLTVLSQPCLPNGITFHAQSEIDNFSTNYPTCTEIEGNVIINGTNINNLHGLNMVTSIHGQLEISQNDSLTTLVGLEKLVSVGDWVTIYKNPRLASMTGLSRLVTISGTLSIVENDTLSNLIGLDSLKFIGGDLQIMHNHNLTSVTGLKSLSSVKNLGFLDNSLLSDLSDLAELTSVSGDIQFASNNGLTTLKGLENIVADSIHSLHIFGNPHLSTCAVQSVCNYLSMSNTTTEIHDNDTNCNSQTEVDTACKHLSVNYLGSQGLISIYPNPVSLTLTIESTELPQTMNLSILDLHGREFIKSQIRENNTPVKI